MRPRPKLRTGPAAGAAAWASHAGKAPRAAAALTNSRRFTLAPRLDYAHVRDGGALGHARHSADVEHHPRRGGLGLEDLLAEIVGDVAERHAGGDVGPALDERIEDARLVAGDGEHALDPH